MGNPYLRLSAYPTGTPSGYGVYGSCYNALNPTPGATTGGTPKGALAPQRTASLQDFSPPYGSFLCLKDEF
ncbi:hypothetical protein PCC6912_32640 [Chlorogloeopsis fritschii PCC 6912]|uniref:Uncharacterized protein n=1 Tax=Chlorogloeopsis fritschii PCC 6912 TaxID=211165 RepID=A0A433NCJ4_CHLFR|nr:hypothetical protein PCC6912_32640 [Chlorogloeopsis fritschii PCC 6912]